MCAQSFFTGRGAQSKQFGEHCYRAWRYIQVVRYMHFKYSTVRVRNSTASPLCLLQPILCWLLNSPGTGSGLDD